MSVEAEAGHGGAVVRGTQAAGPVDGGHAALALGLDVAEADRDRARADVDGVAVDAEFAGLEAGRSPVLAGRALVTGGTRDQAGAGRQGDRPEFQPASFGSTRVEFGPGS